jgi:hypothetical protein
LAGATFASGFGAAASLVVLLVWMYYSAQIFLLGAEFTWIYAHAFGSRSPRAAPPAQRCRRAARRPRRCRTLAASRAALAAALSSRKAKRS